MWSDENLGFFTRTLNRKLEEMSFTGGKLKLKGSGPARVSKKGKKKKSDTKELALVDADQDGADKHQAAREGHYITPADESTDRRTEAERKFEERQQKAEAAKIAKLASKSHRDRVKEFNEALANLTEHHDIPRVGPG